MPHYGRNKQQVTTKTQNGGNDYSSRGEDVGAEGFVGTPLPCHKQETRQDKRYGKNANHIVWIFQKDSFQGHKHYFEVCSGKLIVRSSFLS
jgi:hypothetical protein